MPWADIEVVTSCYIVYLYAVILWFGYKALFGVTVLRVLLQPLFIIKPFFDERRKR